MDQATIQRHLSEARVAHLATIRPGGRPHLVPICFAIDGDLLPTMWGGRPEGPGGGVRPTLPTLFFAIDQKPKRTPDLQRLRNIAANSSVSILVDHYEDDWTKLWWIRLDGHAGEVTGARRARGLELLEDRYLQYQTARPSGPVVAVQIGRTVSWEGAITRLT